MAGAVAAILDYEVTLKWRPPRVIRKTKAQIPEDFLEQSFCVIPGLLYPGLLP